MQNTIRTSPKSIVPTLQQQINSFSNDGLYLKRPGRPNLSTQEGMSAWHEAKAALTY
jgi:hypothetical protein